MFDFVNATDLSLTNGKMTFECTYWWVSGVINGRDIVEAFENYFEEKAF